MRSHVSHDVVLCCFLHHLEYLYLDKIVQGAVSRRLSEDENMHYELKISGVINSQYARTCDMKTGLLQQVIIYDVDLTGSMHVSVPTKVAPHFADTYVVTKCRATRRCNETQHYYVAECQDECRRV